MRTELMQHFLPYRRNLASPLCRRYSVTISVCFIESLDRLVGGPLGICLARRGRLMCLRPASGHLVAPGFLIKTGTRVIIPEDPRKAEVHGGDLV